MKSVHLTARAESDLEDIITHIAEHNLPAARRFNSYLLTQIRKLGSFPLMGSRRDAIEEGVRVYPIKDVLVFYRELEDKVEILHIISRYRDQATLSFE